MKKLKKRQVYIIIGILALVGAIFLTAQFFEMGQQRENGVQRSVEAKPVVSVFTANPKQIDSYISITGRVIPKESIQLFAEVGGILQSAKKPFETGVNFKKGELLVKIEEQEAQQNLIAQKNSFLSTLSRIVPNISIDYPDHYSEWETYISDFDAAKPLPELPETEDKQFRLYLTGNNVYSQYYNIKQLETRFNKYNIYAPFDGTLTETLIEEGTLVRVGQNIGEFLNTGELELEASVALEEIDFVQAGKMVELQSADNTHFFVGEIIRVNDKIDVQTQTVKVFIKIPYHPNIKAGSYVSGRLKAESYDSAVKINNDLLVHNNHLYVVSDSTATLQPVEIKHMSYDSAIVKGLEEGMLVINEVKSPAFEGSNVNIE